MAEDGGGVLQPVVVKALSTVDKDSLLCPVKALEVYLDRTSVIRGDRKKLFIAYKKGHKKEICKSTLSGWIKKTVIKCYHLAERDEDLKRVHKVCAHDVRALAASWALAKNASMDKILLACKWKSHNTFTQFYLKDLTFVRNNLLELGPLVVASQLV